MGFMTHIGKHIQTQLWLGLMIGIPKGATFARGQWRCMQTTKGMRTHNLKGLLIFDLIRVCNSWHSNYCFSMVPNIPCTPIFTTQLPSQLWNIEKSTSYWVKANPPWAPQAFHEPPLLLFFFGYSFYKPYLVIVPNKPWKCPWSIRSSSSSAKWSGNGANLFPSIDSKLPLCKIPVSRRLHKFIHHKLFKTNKQTHTHLHFHGRFPMFCL